MGNAANYSSATLSQGQNGIAIAAPEQGSGTFSTSGFASALLLSAGTLVIAGWYLDLTVLKSLNPGWPSMKVNSAVCFMLCGIALHALADGSQGVRLPRAAGCAAAALTACLGLLTLLQHWTGINLNIDEWLMQQPSTAADTARPGRMSPAGAAAFLALGAALLVRGTGLADGRWLNYRWAHRQRSHGPRNDGEWNDSQGNDSEWNASRRTGGWTASVFLCLPVATMAMLVILGYAYDVELVLSTQPVSSMALHTAFMFAVAAVAILAASPTTSWAADARERTLAAAEEAFRRRILFEQARDGIVVFDADRNVYEANESFARMLGYTVAEVGELHPWDWDVRFNTRELFLQEWPTVPAESGEIEAQFRRSDDSIIDVVISYTPARIRETCFVYCSCRDVTQQKRAERTLHDSEERFRELIEQAADGIFISDEYGRFVLANSRCCELLGYERHELLGMHGSQTYLGEETSATTRRMALLEAGQDLRYERMLKRKDGRTFPAEISVKMLDSGGMQVIFHDITKRHTQERKIARLSRIHAVLSGINSTIVRLRDRRELLTEVCRIAVDAGKFEIAWIGTIVEAQNRSRVLAHFGLPPGAFTGEDESGPMVDLMPNGPVSFSLQEKRPVYENDISKSPHLSKLRRLAIRKGANSVISLPLTEDGQVSAFMVLYAPGRNFFDDEELKLLKELARDISFALEFIAKGEKVSYLASYDSLTGLPNRSLFFETLNRQLESAESSGEKVVLQLFDIDRFSMINETYGRDNADRLIGEIAERARAVARSSDTVARVGPDSFAVAITGAWEAAPAAHALEHLNERVFGRPFILNQEQLRVSATSGVAMFPADGTDANSLLSNAEAALRDAEKQNLQFRFYSSDMNERVADWLRLESRLRQALEDDEILMWYQPKLCVRNRRLTGFEALMRWRDSDSGALIQPSDFIPIMEQTGLILDAGQRALNKVAASCQQWAAQGLEASSVAVNVSLMQLRQPGFVESVVETQALMESTGWVLELELTESVVMENVEAIIPKLETIRGLGVRISVDDFGTGYSSLAYISRLPIHSLKIDRSFVSCMTEDQNSLGIVKSIITLAHSLGLKVIAEGVETEAQADQLAILLCDEMQGYHFSPPVASNAVAPLIRQFV